MWMPIFYQVEIERPANTAIGLSGVAKKYIFF
jgi:hypothetical protein